jgi:hypothetical protein
MSLILKFPLLVLHNFCNFLPTTHSFHLRRKIHPLPIILSFFFLVFFCQSPDCHAVTLTWAANDPIENVTGYKIYYGSASGQYSAFKDVGNVTSCELENVIATLEDGKTYYLAATAYSATSESSFSSEISYTHTTVLDAVTDTEVNDTDGDGISDDDEISFYGTDPNSPDSDNDGLTDGDELDLWSQDWDADYDADNIINLLDDDADGDGILDGEDSEPATIASLFTTAAYPDGAGIKGFATFNNNWQTVNFNAGFDSPVVIAGPSSYNDVAPGLIRLQNVTGNSFEIKFQEWQYLIDQGLAAHGSEENSYLVLEKGVHVMDDGSIWEAGTFKHSASATSTVWKTVYFAAKFPATPYLFLTVQTYNDSQPVIVRVKDLTDAQFNAALFEEEALLDGHAIEKIGYLAVYSPSRAGALNGDDSTYRFALGRTSSNFTSLLGHDIKLQEEQSADTETSHKLETVNALQIGRAFFAQVTSWLGYDPFSLRQRPSFYSSTSFTHLWHTVPIYKELNSPVVIAGPPSFNDADPGVIRLRNVNSSSFEIKFQEWNYLSAKDARIHKLEDASWLVMEPGLYKMSDGSIWGVGTFEINGNGLWYNVNFLQTFAGTPVVYLTMQTCNGSDAVTVRARQVSTAGFQAALFEEEAQMTSGHAYETIGYLAIYSPNGSGAVTIGDQKISYTINIADANNNFTAVAGREIKMEEEQSLDSETTHTIENVNTLNINSAFFGQEISALGGDTAAVRYRMAQ